MAQPSDGITAVGQHQPAPESGLPARNPIHREKPPTGQTEPPARNAIHRERPRAPPLTRLTPPSPSPCAPPPWPKPGPRTSPRNAPNASAPPPAPGGRIPWAMPATDRRRALG